MKTLDQAKLTEIERKSVKEAARVLTSELPVTRVILFGSKARGDAEPDSDIDLLVLTSCPVTTKLRHEISDRIAEINLGNDVMMSSFVASEQDWAGGLIRYMLIHSNVEKDGCRV